MPRSKRSKVTSLTKTASRTTKASKLALVQEIQNEIEKYDHVWLFSVGDMRNEGLKEVRSQWRGTGRMFFGKGRVMQKALGIDEANEYKEGLHLLADVSWPWLWSLFWAGRGGWCLCAQRSKRRRETQPEGCSSSNAARGTQLEARRWS
jgi:hypothetical protein